MIYYSQPLYNIRLQNLSALKAEVIKVWALPISLATTFGIIGYFLFFSLLRCFSSGTYLRTTLYIQVVVTAHYSS